MSIHQSVMRRPYRERYHYVVIGVDCFVEDTTANASDHIHGDSVKL